MKGATRPRSPAQSYLPHSTCPSRLPRARWCRGTTVVALSRPEALLRLGPPPELSPREAWPREPRLFTPALRTGPRLGGGAHEHAAAGREPLRAQRPRVGALLARRYARRLRRAQPRQEGERAPRLPRAAPARGPARRVRGGAKFTGVHALSPPLSRCVQDGARWVNTCIYVYYV